MYFRMCEQIGRYLYFYTCDLGLLCRMDKRSGVVEPVDAIARSTYGKFDTVGCMITYKDKLYMATNDGQYLVEYDVAGGTITEYAIECAGEPWGNVVGISGYGDKIYVFPRKLQKTVMLDLKTKRVSHIPWTVDIGCELARPFTEGDVTWLFAANGENVYELNMQSMEMKMIKPNETVRGVRRVSQSGKEKYFLTSEGDVYRWDNAFSEIEKICQTGTENNTMCFAIANNKIVFLPYCKNEICIYNMGSGEVEVIKELPDDFACFEEVKEWGKYHNVCEDESYFYAVGISNYILRVSKEDTSIEWIKITWDETTDKVFAKCTAERDMRNILAQGHVLVESEEYSLDAFLKILREQ